MANDFNEIKRLKKFYDLEIKSRITRCKSYMKYEDTTDLCQNIKDDIFINGEERFFDFKFNSKNQINIDIPMEFDFNFMNKENGDTNWNTVIDVNELIKENNSVVFPITSIKSKKKNKKKSKQVNNSTKSSERFYFCEFNNCNKKYTSSFGLKYHMREGHTKEKIEINRPSSCPHDDCDKKYKNNNGLKYHLRTIHGEQLINSS